MPEELGKRLQRYTSRAARLIKWMVGQMIAAAVNASSVALFRLRFAGLGGRGSSNG